MIHLTMSAYRPADLSAAEFDEYFRERHLVFAKLLEGLRLLSATRVERFHAAGGGGAPAWVLDAWWDDGDALTRCFRSPGGLALLGDRMTMMDDPLPAIADATEQLRHATARGARFDPSSGPRMAASLSKLHLLARADSSSDVDAVIDSLGPRWQQEGGSTIGAYSVSRGTRASYPLNNIITGIEPPTIPREPSHDTALELWIPAGADLETAAAAHPPLRSLLEDPHVVWWYGQSHEVMMSLPVASFLALDPVESDR